MEELIKKAKNHDHAAFSQLMQKQGQSMYKVAKAILKEDEDVAEDRDFAKRAVL